MRENKKIQSLHALIQIQEDGSERLVINDGVPMVTLVTDKKFFKEIIEDLSKRDGKKYAIIKFDRE
jgi:hypothetical protein